MKKGETFDRMRSLTAYFKRNAESNPAFRPEFEISELVNSKIKGMEWLTGSKVEEMISEINGAEDNDHHNGAGWLDYQLHFSAVMKLNGFEIDCDSSGKMILQRVVDKA